MASDKPILQRVFATTHKRDSVGSTSNSTNTTAASFHSCKSTTTHVGSESQWIVVDGGASDGPEIRESGEIKESEIVEDIPASDDDSQYEKIEGTAEDIPENDDDRQLEKIQGAEDIPANDDDNHFEEIDGADDIPGKEDDSMNHRTYQFDNCNVYMNSFNARGIRVKNSGNYAPRVTRMSCSLLQFSCD